MLPGGVKIKVGLDLDGVVCNYQQYFIDVLNKDRGSNYTLEDWKDWDFSDAHFKGDEFKERVLDSMKHLEYLSPMEGALNGIRRLRNHHTIHVITHRFEEGRLNTLRWLDRYGVDFQSLTFTDKKGKLASILGIDLMIEDSELHAKDLANQGVKVLLYDNLYNQNCSGRLIERVTGWDDIVKILT